VNSLSEVLIQDVLDQFMQAQQDEPNVAQTIELLCEYIAYFSDLSREQEETEPMQMQDWEQPLEQLMEELLEGDVEPVTTLGQLTLGQLDGDHLRDFIAWFLLREPDIDSLQVSRHTQVLRQWLLFLRSLPHSDDVGLLLDFEDAVEQTTTDAIRVCQAAHILFHFVRLGSGMSPRNREKQFSAFIEGHARVNSSGKGVLHLSFDDRDQPIGPIALPDALIDLLQQGDVLDIELGQRDGEWLIVDSGPIYPACIYVEAECFDVPEKVIPA